MLPLTLFLASSLAFVGASLDHHHIRDTHHHRKSNSRRSAGLPTGWSLQSACLTDGSQRLLDSYTFSNNNTPSSCIATCSSKGFTYAAVEWGGECHCGSTLKKSSKVGVSADASQCAISCTGNSSQNCGGNWHLTLYHKSSTSPSSSSSVYAATSTKSAVASATASSIPASKYTLKDSHQGKTFFDNWNFFSDADPTNGLVNYQTKGNASSKGLAYVQDDGIAVMKVDSTSWLSAGQHRDSVRISTKNTYDAGLWILDIVEMPIGCSIWPAAWALGTGATWPNAGEIDIIEGVNNSTMNQMTVHTGADTSCDINNLSLQSLLAGGNFLGKTCTSSSGNNAGCAVQETDPTSYGIGFNAIGGAVYALLVNDEGTKIWRFPRSSNIPADIAAEKPNPDGWGLPSASFPSSNGCKTSDAYKKLTMVFDITLCGDWCESAYSQTNCPGKCADRILDPNNYKTASWKVKSVKVYQ